MKKVLSILIIALIVVMSQTTVARADGETELYPYNKIECLQSLDTCTNYKVGDSNWDLTYNGYNYNVVSGNARYASDFSDDNSNGFIDAFEMPALGWNAFASLIINNTLESFELETANARTDLTSVVQRAYVYFDENGVAQMFEDHFISKNYITNEGTLIAPDWRLATEAEMTAYDAEVAAETIVTGATSAAGTTIASIRLKLDANDADGYVAEPLGYLKWTSATAADLGTVPADFTTDDWSTVLDYNPNNVVIPAGWTVFSFGTLDRTGVNADTVIFLKSLVAAMVDPLTAPMTVGYTDQPAYFTGLTALDDDGATPGINVVVDFNADFDLSDAVEAKWLDMTNATDEVINTMEMLDYSVVISQDGMDLETINFVWNETTMMFDASAAVTVVDSSVFGSGYVATYSVTTPTGETTEKMVDIVVGVMPPTFDGVEDRFVNEGEFLVVLDGITADDGYANDVTDSIVVELPGGFNPYNPQPGAYDINIEFNHHVHIPGSPATIDANGAVKSWDNVLNPTGPINGYGNYAVYTDDAAFAAAGSGWGSVIVVVGADGKMIERYDRYNWQHTTSTGTVVGDAVVFAAWQAAVVIEDGGYVIGAHGSVLSAGFRAADLAFDDMVTVVMGVDDFDADILTQDMFTITVDDTTAPQIMAVNDEYMIYVSDFDNVNEAILSNVAAFDFFDAVDDLAIYVSGNGGLVLETPGTYAVEVTVEDMAGNSAMVMFDVIVVADPIIITQAEVDALIAAAVDPIDGIVLTQTEIQALIDAAVLAATTDLDGDVTDLDAAIAALDVASLTQTEIQALIDSAITAIPEPEVEDTGCASTFGAGSAIILLIATIGGGAFVVLRKRG